MLEEEYSNIFEGNSGSELRRLVKSYIMRVHSSARTYSKARGRLIEDLSGGMSEGDDEDDEKESEVEFVEPVVRGFFLFCTPFNQKLLGHEKSPHPQGPTTLQTNSFDAYRCTFKFGYGGHQI